MFLRDTKYEKKPSSNSPVQPIAPKISLPKPYIDAKTNLLKILAQLKRLDNKGEFGSIFLSLEQISHDPEDKRDFEEYSKKIQTRAYQRFMEAIKNFICTAFLGQSELTNDQSKAIQLNIDEILSLCSPSQKKIFAHVASSLIVLLYNKKQILTHEEVSDLEKQDASKKFSDFNPFISPDLKKRISQEAYLKLAKKFMSLCALSENKSNPALKDTVFDLRERGLSSYCRVFKEILVTLFNEYKITEHSDFLKKVTDPFEEGLSEHILTHGAEVLKKIKASMETNAGANTLKNLKNSLGRRNKSKNDLTVVETPQLYLEEASQALVSPDLFALNASIRESIALLLKGASTVLPKIEQKPYEEQLVANFLTNEAVLTLFGNEDNLKQVFLRWFIKVFFRAENSNIRKELFIKLEADVQLPSNVILKFFQLTYDFPDIIKSQPTYAKSNQNSFRKNKTKESQNDKYSMYAAYCLKSRDLDPLIISFYKKAKEQVDLFKEKEDQGPEEVSNETVVLRKSKEHHPSVTTIFNDDKEVKEKVKLQREDSKSKLKLAKLLSSVIGGNKMAFFNTSSITESSLTDSLAEDDRNEDGNNLPPTTVPRSPLSSEQEKRQGNKLPLRRPPNKELPPVPKDNHKKEEPTSAPTLQM
ncbi:hypothetical protein [Legionella resiliens]|uniref:RasGEF domain protein n=1 Tax=Legionella resiliens TaxID=2905958 RepID=A0ABS8WWN4_9GAMM|nr:MULTISPECIES: hypothetical protein [unclassified Legionella]MCE0721727.1 hypothetical protein [Legionella sp. 9fVS26]MCE3530881.1 hypothetical protein [Legionella sp. 8cVS16]